MFATNQRTACRGTAAIKRALAPQRTSATFGRRRAAALCSDDASETPTSKAPGERHAARLPSACSHPQHNQPARQRLLTALAISEARERATCRRPIASAIASPSELPRASPDQPQPLHRIGDGPGAALKSAVYRARNTASTFDRALTSSRARRQGVCGLSSDDSLGRQALTSTQERARYSVCHAGTRTATAAETASIEPQKASLPAPAGVFLALFNRCRHVALRVARRNGFLDYSLAITHHGRGLRSARAIKNPCGMCAMASGACRATAAEGRTRCSVGA